MKSFKNILLCLLGLLLGQSVLACIQPIPLSERSAQADLIVLAQLQRQFAYQAEGDKRIYTLYILEIKALLKGEAVPDVVALIAEGGQVGDRLQVTFPNFTLALGQEAVLFLEQGGRLPSYAPYAAEQPDLPQYCAHTGPQGVLHWQNGRYFDMGEGRHFTETELFDALKALTGQSARRPDGSPFKPRSISPQNLPGRSVPIASLTDGTGSMPTGGFVAGTTELNSELIINGSGFGGTPGTVWFPNGDDGGSTLIASAVPSDLVYWTDTQIRLKIPEPAGTGTLFVDDNNGATVGSASISIQYGVIPIYTDFYLFSQDTRLLPRLADINGQGGYTFLYNNNLPSPMASFANTPNARDAFERALVTWRCQNGVHFNRDDSGTSQGPAGDNLSVVALSNLGAGTLGSTNLYFSGTANGQCQQTQTRWYIDELDIVFNSTTNWNFGPGPTANNQLDFESVALHELGHALGLAHLIDGSNTHIMHFALNSGQDIRIPAASEVVGASYLVGRGFQDLTPCNMGVSPMNSLPGSCSDLALPVSLLSFEGKAAPEGARLSWSTATEHNNDFFTLERSTDGRRFQAIAQIEGAGFAQETQHYAFTDREHGPGLNYYRLWQTDYDGTQTMIGQLSLRFPSIGASLSVQQPVQGNLLQLAYQSSQAGEVELRLLDSSGRFLAQWQLDSRPGQNNWELPLQNWPAGTYCLQALQGSSLVSHKIVKF